MTQRLQRILKLVDEGKPLHRADITYLATEARLAASKVSNLDAVVAARAAIASLLCAQIADNIRALANLEQLDFINTASLQEIANAFELLLSAANHEVALVCGHAT